MKSNVLIDETPSGEKAPPMARAARTSFDRVLIANRGEIALRAVRACRSLGIESVAVHSQADADTPAVWSADRAVCIGPAPSNRSYLAIDTLLHVAKETGCGAVYPGYGFLAENADFAARCAEEGLVFVGPSADVIRDMGDKARARDIAKANDVPVVPGSEGAFQDAASAEAAARDIGFPMLLKARSGGGGRGMRIVEAPETFNAAFRQAAREAQAAFGDGAVYLERFFPRVRHIEVQVLGDGKGGVLALGERDCSVQRRHQKLVEEAPSPAIDAALRRDLLAAAERLGAGLRYAGAGTVEFILDVESASFHFIEMNTRIQVEHPVTEMLTGLDLVQAQLGIALGEGLPAFDPEAAPGGHAIEFRINAEDWTRDFAPSPGRITHWQPPRGAGIRLDSAAYAGWRIPPYYDSMIGKLIVHGADREATMEKARSALSSFACEGVETTIGFHRALLAHEDFRGNRVHTRWVEETALTPADRRVPA